MNCNVHININKISGIIVVVVVVVVVVVAAEAVVLWNAM